MSLDIYWFFAEAWRSQVQCILLSYFNHNKSFPSELRRCIEQHILSKFECIKYDLYRFSHNKLCIIDKEITQLLLKLGGVVAMNIYIYLNGIIPQNMIQHLNMPPYVFIYMYGVVHICKDYVVANFFLKCCC
jgi:hypothetical protein